MNKEEMMNYLKENKMTEILELIEDAENGQLEELELAKSIGLLRDVDLNDAVINHLTENGVSIIYLEDEE